MVPRRLLDALVSMRGSSPGAPCPHPRSIRAPSAAGLRPRHANEGERVGIPHCRTGRAPELPLTTLLGSSGMEGGPPLARGMLRRWWPTAVHGTRGEIQAPLVA